MSGTNRTGYNPAMILARPFLAAVLLAVPLRAAEDFTKLADDFWSAQMRFYPLTATFLGEPGHDAELEDNGPSGRAAQKAEWAALMKRLRAVDAKKLPPEEKLSVEVMRTQLELWLAGLDLPFFELEVDHMDGGQTWIPTVIQTAQPMTGEEDAAKFERRLKAMPLYFRRHMDNLRAGLKTGRVAARVPTEKLARQIAEMIATPLEKTPYAAACDRLPEPARAAWKPRLLGVVEKEVFPAYGELLAFLNTEYLPKTRTGEKIGLSEISGGRAMYRHNIKAYTTVSRSPEDLHATGLSELEQIREEMKQIARRAGHAGDVQSFLETVRRDPKNFYTTREDVRGDAEKLVAKCTAMLPDWFGRLPKTPVVVKPIEEYQEKNDAAARYFQPPSDLSRPGVYYINTYKPDSRPRFGQAALAAHEGVPGHHLQIALAMENQGIPKFRRNAGFGAFVEGWALYSERLADEMGLYEDDLSRLGMLSAQALRACRLVVDTGIHAKGWTREKAIDFMKANTPMSQDEIEAEVDRYTVWPGQALGYKVGQREIELLRAEVRERTGRRFDVKAFHDAVLSHGPLPLPVLRRAVLEAFPPR